MSDNLHALAAAYALDALDQTESGAFEEHLTGCDLCDTDVREMRETAAALAASVAETPPASLRSRVLEQASQTPQSESTTYAPVASLAEHKSRRLSTSRWLAGVAAAAMIVAGGLGISTYQVDQRADEAQVAAGEITALLADPGATVRRSEVVGGGTGTLVYSPTREQAAFLTVSVPATAPDQTYQLWAIDGGGATSLGLLQPDAGRGSALVDLPEGTTTFGMSVEPAGGSAAPTTDPVLLLELAT
ncbi:MAG: anti-sigma factor [Actinomycetia bacterium]|nr:anti-sigma factor [Actinomycetes bacterium]